MHQQTYKRVNLAIEQLDVAIELFLSEKSYISALTLAGAAEEILGKSLNHNERINSLDESFSTMAYFEKMVKEIRSEEYCENTFKKQFLNPITGVNKAKNELKHWTNKSELVTEVS